MLLTSRAMSDEEEEKTETEPDEEPPAPPAEGEPDWKPDTVFGTRPAFALAFLTGILVPIAFAGIGVWYVEFVAWVPLILALRGQTPRRALALGWLSGFLQVAIGFYWLTSMLKTFSGFDMPLCLLFAAILSAYQGGRIALLGWAYARATKRGWHPSVVFAAAFALSELVYPLLFPWYTAAAFHEHPILMQTAEIGGPILVSLTVIAFNLALAEVVRWRLHGGTLDRATVIAGPAVMIASLVFGDLRMRSIDALMQKSEAVTIGLVQPNLSLNDQHHGLDEGVKLSAEAKKQGAELLVWSEAVIPGGMNVKSYQAELHRRLARRLELPAVVSGILVDPIPGAKKGERWAYLYNSAFMVEDKAEVLGHYDKQFLLMFGEYIPFGDTFPIVYKISQNSGAFSSGTSFAPLKHGKHRIAAMICYEDIIPSFINKLVAEGDPDLLVNLTNDRWFQNQEAGHGGETDTTEPIQHYALAKLRTIEHRMFLARVSNSGISGLIDANGRVIVQTGTMRQASVVGQARYMRVHTVYAALGDYPWWAVSALVIAAGFVDNKRKRAAPRV